MPLERFFIELKARPLLRMLLARFEENRPCGDRNDSDHALTCKKGGYSILRHNALCNTEAMIMREAGCTDVKLEPHLLPVNPELYKKTINTQDEAHLDISARGIHGTFERTFCDVRVTHPNCPSSVYKPLASIYKDHEQQKKTEYEERVIQSEKGSFVPLVFSTLGGIGQACDKMNKRLARRIAERKSEHYPLVIHHVRTRLRFSLLRGILVSITGERRSGSQQHDRNAGDNHLYNVSFNIIPRSDHSKAP